MNTTRDLRIAEAMGYKGIIDDNGKVLINKDVLTIWNPSENAEQREMIKDKLREWNIGYSSGYNSLEKLWWSEVGSPREKRSNVSESEAFLQAVEQLINLKTK